MFDLSTLNPQQRQAVETIRGPVLILAGAGTGKTRVITFRVAHMIDRGIAPGSILGVTFTNKAAREMQERVFKLIRRKGQSPKSKVQSHGSGAQPSAADQRPTICTFHSLCVRILRQHIEKLGTSATSSSTTSRSNWAPLRRFWRKSPPKVKRPTRVRSSAC